MMDGINHAKFQLDRFRGFGAPSGRNRYLRLTGGNRPYNSIRTNVLHCDIGKCRDKCEKVVCFKTCKPFYRQE